MAGDLTTTSYAVLGLLALRPWTTYELAQQMDRALGQFWPRARSKLYEEPKKLVAHGLATATRESTGRRPRTVYAITRQGRRALAQWVRTPPERRAPTLEFEPLIKVFFAEHGSKTDLLRTLAGLREWADSQAELGVEISAEYLEGRGPFPERLAWNILVGQFLDQFDALVDQWAAWATEIVEQWPDDPREATPDVATLQAMSDRNRVRASTASSGATAATST
jgi:PadR family transcriptional regulator AphA